MNFAISTCDVKANNFHASMTHVSVCLIFSLGAQTQVYFTLKVINDV